MQHRVGLFDEEESRADQAGDRADFEHHQDALDATARLDAEAVDPCKQCESCDHHRAFRVRQVGEFKKVAGKGDGHGGHATGLYDQKERPAVKKPEDWMDGLAEVFILSAHQRDAVAKFGIDEGAQNGQAASRDPNGKDQKRGMQALRHDVRIHENTGADYAAHHHHGCVKQAELRCQPGGCRVGRASVGLCQQDPPKWNVGGTESGFSNIRIG
jgi:hypothetical protein